MSPASAAIDRIVEVTKPTAFTWEGEQQAGTNANYFGGYVVGTPDTPLTPVDRCDKSFNSYCEVILFKVTNPITAEEQAAGVTKKTAKVRISIDWAATPVVNENTGTEPTDFDLLAYASNDLGERGDEIGSSTQGDTINETAQFTLDTFVNQPSAWVLVRVVYFAVPNQNGYTGNLTFPN